MIARMLQAAVLAALMAAPAAGAQESPGRTELKRADLSGAPAMEVVSSIGEYAPGAELALHVHHGVEAVYVIQGAMIQAPGKEPRMLPTGADLMNLRDVPHAGFKVVGTQSLKLFTVHVVDKGKPLYDKAQ